MRKFNERIAILTDIHANEEALTAIINDIKERKIKHIISLGDLVGLGPNPKECVDLAMENNIINIPGNNDFYNILPFDTYRHLKRNHNGSSYKNAEWTKMQLTEKQIEFLKSMPPSMDIVMNNRLIGLCHFPCDVRYFSHSVWEYDANGPRIFLTTNTENDEIHNLPKKHEGKILAEDTPLFGGKTIDEYDSIIFGHYHFQQQDKLGNTTLLSLNGSGVAIKDNAIYYILEPDKNGYNISKVAVPFDKEKLYNKLDNMNYPKKETFELFINKR